jgi:hypothetical protein
MQDDPRGETQRARWRQDKSNQRARQRPPTPPPPPDELVEDVMAERDRRLVREYAMWRHPEMVTHAYRYTLLEFSADVWAAKVLLEHQYGVGRAAPTKIVRWLVANGRTHGCQENSLRTMVYRAFQKISRLEAEPYLYDRTETVWPPFSGND